MINVRGFAKLKISEVYRYICENDTTRNGSKMNENARSESETGREKNTSMD